MPLPDIDIDCDCPGSGPADELKLFDFCWLSGDGSIGGGAVMTGTGGGTRAGPFLGESHVPMSILCLPGTIGGGGIPGPFFFKIDELELV